MRDYFAGLVARVIGTDSAPGMRPVPAPLLAPYQGKTPGPIDTFSVEEDRSAPEPNLPKARSFHPGQVDSPEPGPRLLSIRNEMSIRASDAGREAPHEAQTVPIPDRNEARRDAITPFVANLRLPASASAPINASKRVEDETASSEPFRMLPFPASRARPASQEKTGEQPASRSSSETFSRQNTEPQISKNKIHPQVAVFSAPARPIDSPGQNVKVDSRKTEPDIHISIGKIEVRAAIAQSAPRRVRTEEPVMTLQQYLRKGGRGDRR